MTQFGFQPRMAGSKFFERTRPIAKAPIPPPGWQKPPPAKRQRRPRPSSIEPTSLVEAVTEAIASNRAHFYRLHAIERALADVDEPEPENASRPTIRQIIRDVATEYGFSVDDIASRRRNRPLIIARHAVFAACNEHTRHSLPVIGRVVGGFDHTTVLHGIRRHKQRVAKGLVDG